MDDLAFLRPVEICRAFIETVQAKWRTSDPEWLGADPVNLLRSGANPARGGLSDVPTFVSSRAPESISGIRGSCVACY